MSRPRNITSPFYLYGTYLFLKCAQLLKNTKHHTHNYSAVHLAITGQSRQSVSLFKRHTFIPHKLSVKSEPNSNILYSIKRANQLYICIWFDNERMSQRICFVIVLITRIIKMLPCIVILHWNTRIYIGFSCTWHEETHLLIKLRTRALLYIPID